MEIRELRNASLKRRALIAFLLILGLGPSAVSLWAEEWETDIQAAAKLNKRGDLQGAEDMLLKTMYLADSFPESDPRLAYTLDYLGTINMQMNEPDKAAPILERAVKAFSASRGPQAPETLESMARLAECDDALQDFKSSEPVYRALVDAGRGDALQQSVDLNSLAVSIDAQGRQEEALPIYQKALDLRVKLGGSESPELPEILNNMARVYYLQAKYSKAEPIYLRAIAIDEKNLAPGDPQMADDYRRLEALYKKTGEDTKAKACESKALAVDAAAAKAKAEKKAS